MDHTGTSHVGLRISNQFLVAAFITVVLVALGMLIFPIYVIRPFRYQGPIELAIALLIRRWSPLITSICTALALLLATIAWQRTKDRRLWLKRSGFLAGAALVIAASFLTRVNIFEKMFHPITTANFVPADGAHVDRTEMVLAVTIGAQQRAYPITIIAYHHILNDVLGGVPLAITY